MFSWRKQNFFYLLLIFAPSFLESKNSFLYFSIVLLFFCICCVFLVFPSFSILFFWCLSFFDVFQTKKLLNKNFFEKYIGFWKVFFWFFLEEGTFFWSKKCSKFIIWLFFKKKISLKRKEKTLISRFTRVEDRMRHSVVIDLGRGTFVASSHLSFFASFFFSNKQVLMLKNIVL